LSRGTVLVVATLHPSFRGSNGVFVELVLDNMRRGMPAPPVAARTSLGKNQRLAWDVLWYALADGLWYTVQDLMPYAQATAPRITVDSVASLLDRAKLLRLVEWVPDHRHAGRRFDQFRRKQA